MFTKYSTWLVSVVTLNVKRIDEFFKILSLKCLKSLILLKPRTTKNVYAGHRPKTRRLAFIVWVKFTILLILLSLLANYFSYCPCIISYLCLHHLERFDRNLILPESLTTPFRSQQRLEWINENLAYVWPSFRGGTRI